MDSEQLNERIENFRKQKLSLDMTRGKPGPEQLDICNGMLTIVDENNFRTPSGLDVRNYGGLDGFPEAKKLFADFLEVSPEEVIIGGNASLNLMYDTVAQVHDPRDLRGREALVRREDQVPLPGSGLRQAFRHL